MASDDDDIIRAAEDHDIPVFSFDCEISNSIYSFDGLPVFAVPLVILPDGPEHGWPRGFDDKKPPGSRFDRFSVFINYIGFNTGNWFSGKTRAHRLTDHGRNHVHPRLCLPPCVKDRDLVLSNDMVIPLECLRVERFSDRSDYPQ